MPMSILASPVGNPLPPGELASRAIGLHFPVLMGGADFLKSDMTITERLTTALAGRYRLERHLGEGGMAMVYLAEDLKHKRKVALKVLRPELAAILGAERFLKEIELTANLQHPNILPLYDSGEADTFLYYVMPFVRGESLRDKLNRERQLGVDEAIEITKSVAAALHYAHERQVIHRDIKPENILIQSGQALVADFGIALAVSQAGGTRLTQTGLSLGTPAYMSPEQATGDRVLDARSDIYSLGCMTYEMLVGEPPHVGNSVQAIIAKILSERPAPVSQTRDLVAPNVDAAVQKALAKSPADRFRSAAEYAAALTNVTFTLPATVKATGAGRRSQWKQVAAVPLAVFGVVMMLLAIWGSTRPRPSVSVARLLFLLPDSAALQQQFGTLFALSDDGSRLVYVGPGENDIGLWQRPLNSLTASRILGTEGADSPFLTRDGQTVAFYRNGPNAVFTVSLLGGPRRTVVTDSMVPLGGDFGPDGSMYFTRTGGIRRLAPSGVIEEVTRVDTARGEIAHGWPDVLPSGNVALFTVRRLQEEQYDVAAVDLRSKKVEVITRGTFARYAPSGHIVYTATDGGLFAVAFDEKALATRGSPQPVVAGVVFSEGGVSHYAIARSGALLYSTGGDGGAQQLEWLDRQGRTVRTDTTLRGALDNLALSPDGNTIAITLRDGSGLHIWTKDVNGPVGKLTQQGQANHSPSWLPDGKEIAYTASIGGKQHLRKRRADGSAAAESLFAGADPIQYGFVTRDGEWIFYETASTGPSLRDIFARRTRGDTTTHRVAATSASETSPALSPDGRWLAFTSAESNRREVFVIPFPGVNASRVQVSLNGGAEPVWSPNGQELFYTSANAELVAARVANQPALKVLDRTTLFSRAPFQRTLVGQPMYAVTSDGQQFVMTRARGRSSEQLVLVLNWTAELKATGARD
jgi:tRNA A-37 threonylcarbamoyl transferase component Bud32